MPPACLPLPKTGTLFETLPVYSISSAHAPVEQPVLLGVKGQRSKVTPTHTGRVSKSVPVFGSGKDAGGICYSDSPDCAWLQRLKY